MRKTKPPVARNPKKARPARPVKAPKVKKSAKAK